MKSVFLQLAMDLNFEKEQRDFVTGLKSRTNAGRPNWNKVFTKIKEQRKGKVTVFFCGNPMLGKTLKEKCNEFGFTFRKEVFWDYDIHDLKKLILQNSVYKDLYFIYQRIIIWNTCLCGLVWDGLDLNLFMYFQFIAIIMGLVPFLLLRQIISKLGLGTSLIQYKVWLNWVAVFEALGQSTCQKCD